MATLLFQVNYLGQKALSINLDVTGTRDIR
jgi:hypothetical protein